MNCDTNIDAFECRWVIECDYWCDTNDRNDDNDDIIITNNEIIVFFSLSHLDPDKEKVASSSDSAMKSKLYTLLYFVLLFENIFSNGM